MFILCSRWLKKSEKGLEFHSKSPVQMTLEACAVYVAFVVAVWGVVDLAVGAFSLPDHFLRLIMIGSVAGLPIVAATTWFLVLRRRKARRPDWLGRVSPHWSGVIAGGVSTTLIFFVLLLSMQPYKLPVTTDSPARIEYLAAIAIMPFENLSNDGANEHFAIGIADGIVTNLQSWGVFPVIGRSSTEPYRGTSPDLIDVASTLKVRYLLTGSVVAAQDGIRVTAELVDGRNHSIVKALGPFDRPRLDVFDIQDEISDAIVIAIVPEMVRREMRPALLERPAELSSWELVMRAQGLTIKGEYEAAREAERLLRIAIRRDPGYAAAYARLAELGHNFSSTNYARIIGDESASEALREALDNARIAVDLSPSLVDARIWYGHLLLHHRQIERAVSELLEAVRLSPSHGQAHAELGFAYALRGEFDKAFQEFELSSRLSPNDPRNVRIRTFKALAYLYAGENAKALAEARSLLETNRGLASGFYPNLVAVSALVRLQRPDEARKQAEEFREQLGPLDWPSVKRGAWTEQQLKLLRADFESIGALSEDK